MPLLLLIGVIGLAITAFSPGNGHSAPPKSQSTPLLAPPGPPAGLPRGVRPDLKGGNFNGKPLQLAQSAQGPAGSAADMGVGDLEQTAYDAGATFDGLGKAPKLSEPASLTSSGDPQYAEALRRIEDLRVAKADNPSKTSGDTSNGKLRDAFQIPAEGYGYAVLAATSRGRRNFGTDELGLGLMALGAQFQKDNPDSPALSYGDVSKPKGGEISGHESHEAGRDVDIALLATDRDGVSARPDYWPNFDDKGRSGRLRFDAARNWKLLCTMLENPIFGENIQLILLDKSLIALLRKQAKDETRVAQGQDKERLEALSKRAFGKGGLLRHYKNHKDHFHLRLKRGNRPVDEPLIGETVDV